MAPIKNILFDLGGVLIDIDYQRPVNEFAKLGFADFDTHYSQHNADELFIRLEKGEISPEQFYQILQSSASAPVSFTQLEQAWNSILLDFRPDSISMLQKLRPKYKTYLLSNTNAIHHRAFSDMFEDMVANLALDDFFDKSYYSHLIGKRKPDAEAYQFVLDDAGIRAEETLFIDDTRMNIEAAAALGFRVHELKKGEKIEKLVKDMNLI